jgi:hypothetical protein
LVFNRSAYEQAILLVSFPVWQIAVGMGLSITGRPPVNSGSNSHNP